MSKTKIVGIVCLLLALAGVGKAIPATLRHDYSAGFVIGRFTPMLLLALCGVWLLTKKSKKDSE